MSCARSRWCSMISLVFSMQSCAEINMASFKRCYVSSFMRAVMNSQLRQAAAQPARTAGQASSSTPVLFSALQCCWAGQQRSPRPDARPQQADDPFCRPSIPTTARRASQQSMALTRLTGWSVGEGARCGQSSPAQQAMSDPQLELPCARNDHWAHQPSQQSLWHPILQA